MGVARSITTSHSSNVDPYMLDEEYRSPATSEPHEYSQGSGSRPRRLPSKEDAEEEDGEWVNRAEVEHARRMVAALLDDQTRIQSIQQEMVSIQEMFGMMGEIAADLSCMIVENGIELAQSREQGIVLLWMVLVLFGFVMALFLAC